MNTTVYPTTEPLARSSTAALPRGVAQTGVLAALGEPRAFQPSLMLGLANLPLVPGDQAIAALRAYVGSLDERVERALARRGEQRPLADFVEALFDYGVVMARAERAWIVDLIVKLEAEMPAIDLKKDLKRFYSPSARQFEIVEVPPLKYLMLDGSGDPTGAESAYREAIGALYSVAYTLKFAAKKSGGPEFTVMPLEGLWWSNDLASFSLERKGEWQWTAMMLMPDAITEAMVRDAIAEVIRKRAIAAAERIRLETYEEGLSVQIMHVGPYEAEAPTIARMHGEFIPANGLAPAGKHHEIYLSDPNRTAPEKLKTVLRQPVRRIE